MIELFNFPKAFDGWPEDIKKGKCRVLFHKISGDSLIVHSWQDGSFDLKDFLYIYLETPPTVPNGIYRILTIIFFEDGSSRHFLAATNPFNYTANDVLLDEGRITEAPADLVLQEETEWEKSVSIGNKDDLNNIKYAEAHFVCSDCLLTGCARIGPAELYPLSLSGVIDLSSSIKEAMLYQGLRHVPFDDIANGIFAQKDRLSPIFCVSFRRIYRDDRELILPLLPYIKRVFGILSITRGAYPKLLGGIYLKQKDGLKDIYYMSLNSYYRGNLVGGSVANENSKVWNLLYANSESSKFKTEIMSKFSSACAEVDLDISYFRLWSIIESISNVKRGKKDLKTVKGLIAELYLPQDVEKIVRLELGEQRFSFNDLLQMWIDWRDCTAHNGGIYSYFDGHRKINKNIVAMIEEMKKNNIPLEFGEDRSLMVLRDVCSKLVEAYINDKV